MSIFKHVEEEFSKLKVDIKKEVKSEVNDRFEKLENKKSKKLCCGLYVL